MSGMLFSDWIVVGIAVAVGFGLVKGLGTIAFLCLLKTAMPKDKWEIFVKSSINKRTYHHLMVQKLTNSGGGSN